jgi:hypothetical protein
MREPCRMPVFRVVPVNVGKRRLRKTQQERKRDCQSQYQSQRAFQYIESRIKLSTKSWLAVFSDLFLAKSGT